MQVSIAARASLHALTGSYCQVCSRATDLLTLLSPAVPMTGDAVLRPDVERGDHVLPAHAADGVVHRRRERDRGADPHGALVLDGALAALDTVVDARGRRPQGQEVHPDEGDVLDRLLDGLERRTVEGRPGPRRDLLRGAGDPPLQREERGDVDRAEDGRREAPAPLGLRATLRVPRALRGLRAPLAGVVGSRLRGLRGPKALPLLDARGRCGEEEGEEGDGGSAHDLFLAG